MLNGIADGHTARAQDIAQSSTADIGMPVAYASVIVHASAERQPLVKTAL